MASRAGQARNLVQELLGVVFPDVGQAGLGGRSHRVHPESLGDSDNPYSRRIATGGVDGPANLVQSIAESQRQIGRAPVGHGS
jgi:hypothetical protein